MIDLTTITTPFGLLMAIDPERASALRAHGGPYDVWTGTHWHTCGHAPAFSAELTYRVSPSPIAAQDRERGAA